MVMLGIWLDACASAQFRRPLERARGLSCQEPDYDWMLLLMATQYHLTMQATALCRDAARQIVEIILH